MKKSIVKYKLLNCGKPFEEQMAKVCILLFYIIIYRFV